MGEKTNILKAKYLVSVRCVNINCGKEFKKYNSEYKRSIKLGRKQYCSLSCYGKSEAVNVFKNLPEEMIIKNHKNIFNFRGNRRDYLSPFRYFIKVMKNRNRRKKWSNDFDVNYLYEIWEKQNGICPYTGFSLILPKNVCKWEDKKCNIRNASIDRIDNSKGYVRGNV